MAKLQLYIYQKRMTHKKCRTSSLHPQILEVQTLYQVHEWLPKAVSQLSHQYLQVIRWQ